MNNRTCIICLEDTKANELLKPCKCNSFVHRSCLKKWIEIKSDPEFCEICRSKYNVDFIIIPIQERTIILDNIYNNSLNDNLFIIISIIMSLMLIVIIFVTFKRHPNNYVMPVNSSITDISDMSFKIP